MLFYKRDKFMQIDYNSTSPFCGFLTGQAGEKINYNNHTRA